MSNQTALASDSLAAPSSSSSSSSTAPSSGWTAGRTFLGAFGGAAAGAVGNVALYFVFGALGVALTARFAGPDGPVSALPVVAVVASSFVPALFAALVGLAVGKFSRRPARVYTVIAVAFGALSMMGPARLGGASLGLILALSAMHVVSGFAITAGILRANRA